MFLFTYFKDIWKVYLKAEAEKVYFILFFIFKNILIEEYPKDNI